MYRILSEEHLSMKEKGESMFVCFCLSHCDFVNHGASCYNLGTHWKALNE